MSPGYKAFCAALCALFFFFTGALSSAQARQNFPGYMNLVVNGESAGQVGYLLQDDGGVMLDAKGLLEQVPGAEYYSMGQGTGFASQYGSIISFAGKQREIGFVSCQEVELDYQLKQEGGMLLAPLNFLSLAVNGFVDFLPQFLEIRVQNKAAPEAIGATIPEARKLAENLSGAFEIGQGELTLANAIDMFAAGYTPDCNGNNAGFPYFVIQAPPSSRTNEYNQLPIVFQMDQDEAIVAMGYTPAGGGVLQLPELSGKPLLSGHRRQEQDIRQLGATP